VKFKDINQSQYMGRYILKEFLATVEKEIKQ
jgi:hypothetical protein